MFYRTLSTLTLTCAALVGCGSSGPERTAKHEVFPVEGVVTLDGKPLADADVVFYSDKYKQSAFGRSDSEGHFQITTFSAGDGAVEGAQQITVSKMAVSTEPPAADIESTDYVPPDTTPTKKKAAPPASLVPERYTTSATSGLTTTVKSDGENTLTLELTSKK